MKRNIFVIFAIGTGGNHLCNLISNSSIFSPRAGPQDYLNHASNNAHCSTPQNLDVTQIQNISILDNQVLCGHWGEFYWLVVNNLIEKFQNKQIVIVKFPKRESIAYDRFVRRSRTDHDYLIEEQRSLYSRQVVEAVFKIPDIFEIETDMFFTKSLNEFFQFTTTEMNLALDQNRCNSMHQIWFEKIKCEKKIHNFLPRVPYL